jgi:hypothetical protein
MLRAILITCLVFASFTSQASACWWLFFKTSDPFQEWILQSRPFAREKRHLELTDPALPIAIIGAGPRGLAAMKALRDVGIPFRGFESHSEVGGLWNPSNPNSVAYDSLTANSSTATTYLDTRMSKEGGDYPSAERALHYLKEFERRHHLSTQIEFNTAVESAEKRGNHWVVAYKDAAGERKELAVRAVITGHGGHTRESAKYPQDLWDQAEAGGLSVRHSSTYKNAEEYRGKRVVILGAGNSGTELATEISKVAKRTILSVRSTPWIAPLYALGRPADEVATENTPIPHWLQMWLFNLIQRRAVGHPTSLGFPAPDHRLLDRLPLSDRGISAAILAGHVQVRSNVRAIAGNTVRFEDISQANEEIDAIVFATGYERIYPFLERKHWPVRPPSLRLFSHDEPGLVFMSEVSVPQGGWPIFMAQAEAIAAYFEAEERLSYNMSWYNERLRDGVDPSFKGHIFSHADDYHVDPKVYAAFLKKYAAWITQ